MECAYVNKSATYPYASLSKRQSIQNLHQVCGRRAHRGKGEERRDEREKKD